MRRPPCLRTPIMASLRMNRHLRLFTKKPSPMGRVPPQGAGEVLVVLSRVGAGRGPSAAKAKIRRIFGFAKGETDFDNPLDWQNHLGAPTGK